MVTAWERTFTPQLIAKLFPATKIYSFNKNVVDEAWYISASVMDVPLISPANLPPSPASATKSSAKTPSMQDIVPNNSSPVIAFDSSATLADDKPIPEDLLAHAINISSINHIDSMCSHIMAKSSTPPPIAAVPLPRPSLVATALLSALSAKAPPPPSVAASPLPPPASPLPPAPATAIGDIFRIEQASAKTSKTPDKWTITTNRVLTSDQIIAQMER
ncbi:hypothetical protein ElyMa_001706700 [Elysia marginata]|uniref:Uncharacterized protein n=1 Tax=Elysia marginata TaxID=1093978 RepID=A0AAV4JX53_9GAST|nr:hypothetical protein ElyMa_001706700 [Elysia marginata]